MSMRRGFFFFNFDILKCERVKKNNTMMITYKIILTQMCHILISGE